MLTQTFEDSLFYPQSKCLAEFPSPESLKHRIIISTKPPKEYLESKRHKDKANILMSGGRDSSEEETSGLDTPDLKGELEVEDKVSLLVMELYISPYPYDFTSQICGLFTLSFSNNKYRVTVIKMMKIAIIRANENQEHPSTSV